MARQDAGKYVSRAGATGGGRTYRARVPYRWYSGLALIVVLGIFLIVYSRYENTHLTTASTVQPTTSDHWVAGLVFDLCGKNQQTLAASSTAQQGTLGLYSSGNGVLQIQPKSSAESGTNATLGKFASQFTGLNLTGNSVGLPKQAVLKDGSKCPAGTPDAGKTGQLTASILATASASSPSTQTGDLRTIRFLQTTEIISVGFVPSGTTLPAPTHTLVAAVQQAAANAVPTTTTTSAISATTSATAKSGTTSTTAKGSASGSTTTTSGGSGTTTTTAANTTTTTSAGTTTTTG